MGNRDFDKYLKEQLENIHTPFQPDDWDSMEGLLDQEGMIADDQFDQFLKNGLDKVAPIYHTSEWSSMEKILEQQAVLADDNFDDFVKDGLEQTNPAYQNSEWSGMEKLLNKKEGERRELVYIKGIELILVILAALTLYMFFPIGNDQIQDNPFDHNPNPIVSTTDIHDASNEIDIENINSIETSNNLVATNNNLATTEIKTVEDSKQFLSHNKTSNYNSTTTLNNNNINSQGISNGEIAMLHPTTVSNTNHNTIKKEDNHLNIISNNTIDQASTLEEELLEKTSVLNTKVNEVKIPSLTSIATLNEDELHFDKPNFEMTINKIKPTIRLSYQIGLDRNHVFTAYDNDTESSFKQGNYGFSAGVKSSVRKGRWEFETGLAYIKKQYNPSPIYEITGNTREGYEAETLKKLNFNMITVPLDLRFYLRNMSNKWNFYITTGAAFNTVAWSNYDRYTYTIDNKNNPGSFTDGRAPKLRDVQQAGIFNGGPLKDNFYATAALGFGAEVNLDERVSFFAQPKFTYYLLPANIGLGPNNDHFNTISLDLGLRFNL